MDRVRMDLTFNYLSFDWSVFKYKKTYRTEDKQAQLIKGSDLKLLPIKCTKMLHPN